MFLALFGLDYLFRECAFREDVASLFEGSIDVWARGGGSGGMPEIILLAQHLDNAPRVHLSEAAARQCWRETSPASLAPVSN